MNHFTMGQTLGTLYGPQISPPSITWGMSQHSTSSTFVEASTFCIIRGRWRCVYECLKHPGCYKVIQLTLGSDFQERHVVPSASIICCPLLCSDAWAGSLKEYQHRQQVPNCLRRISRASMESLQLALHPPRQAAQAALDAPSFLAHSTSVQLCPSVLVTAMPTVLGVEAGLSAFDTNKSCVLGCSGCSEKVPSTGCLSNNRHGFLPVREAGSSRSGRFHGQWELCSRCVPKDWKAPDNWKKFPFCVCVWAYTDVTPWVLVRIIKLIDCHRETQKAALWGPGTYRILNQGWEGMEVVLEVDMVIGDRLAHSFPLRQPLNSSPCDLWPFDSSIFPVCLHSAPLMSKLTHSQSKFWVLGTKPDTWKYAEISANAKKKKYPKLQRWE